MQEHSYEIVHPETGAVVLTLDKDGLKDGSNRKFDVSHMISWPLLAASVDSYIWTCHEGVWQLTGARSIISVTGGSNAAVNIVYCSGVTAIGSGVAQLSAALDLEETAPNRQNGTLIASPNDIFPGDSLAVDFSGTLTGLVGVLTVLLKRVQ